LNKRCTAMVFFVRTIKNVCRGALLIGQVL
jgi:hypothetical protein